MSSITLTPNTTTSMTKGINSTIECDYYSSAVYSISSSQIIVDSVAMNKSDMKIEFDIQMNAVCTESSCNIFYFGTYDRKEYVSLSIDGSSNYFEITSVTDYDYTDIYRIPNANTLLPVDNDYHNIYLILNAHPNVFKLDNFVRYYYSTLISPSNSTYQLYMSNARDPTTQATVSNICIQSAIYTNDKCEVCDAEIACGQTLTSVLTSSSDIDYLYFNLSTGDNTSHSKVIFDSCGSSYDTYLYLYDINFNILFQSDDDGDCNTKTQLTIDTLHSGEYILGISGFGVESLHVYGEWEIQLLCNDSEVTNETVNTNPTPYRSVYNSQNTWLRWWEIETGCERLYGTSLATVITEQDMKDAVDLVRYFNPFATNISVYIGMFRLTTNQSAWKWIDGTPCNYTVTGYCSDDIHWNDGQPDNILSYREPLKTYLLIQGDTNNVTIHDYDADNHLISEILCNAPQGRYKVRDCTNSVNCWIRMDCCDDSYLNVDASMSLYDERWGKLFRYRPEIAYWNSTVFIVGYDEIHYTHFELFDNQFVWKSKSHNEYKTYRQKAGETPWFAQGGSFLYLYSEDNGYDSGTNPNVLMQINLDNLSVQTHVIPETPPDYAVSWYDSSDTYCMVAGNHYVHIMREPIIVKFNANDGTWNTALLELSYDTTTQNVCVMSNDGQFIYIFYWSFLFDKITKYEIKSGRQYRVNTPNLCISPDSNAGISVYGGIVAIAARDNKIYFHGCYIASWKTLIFDTQSDRFEEEETIDIDIASDTSNYRESQMAVFDDNVLLLIHTTDANDIALYYALTDVVSINLAETEDMTRSVWPSDGFSIKYWLNDFDRNVHESDIDITYSIVLYSNDTIEDINMTIVFNTSNDNCSCDESIYKCVHCEQHFDLRSHLSIGDNSVNELQFYPHSHSLIIPTQFIILLERCDISLNSLDRFTTDVDPSVNFTFILSQNCHSRSETNFSLNIESMALNISKEVILTMGDNETQIIQCHICDTAGDDCHICSNNKNVQTVVIYHETHNLENGEYDIFIESNMIDLRVISAKHHIIQYVTEVKERITVLNNDLWHLLWLSVLLIPIIYGIVLYRRGYMNAFIVDKALVLIIGVSQFDEKTAHLPGVKRNVLDLKELWDNKYQYDVFICNPTTLYCTKSNVINFIDEYLPKLEETLYQAIIVHIISHGLSDIDSFMCSDSKNVKIDFIKHEITTKASDADNVKLIKLIFHHGCQGQQNYSVIDEVPVKNTQLQTRGPSIHILADAHNSISNTNIDTNMAHDSNLVIVSGNIKGRTMSDSGNFTKCICESFGDNVQKRIKADFNTLIVEIGRNLEHKTKKAELCNVHGTLRYNRIRFEKCNDTDDNKMDGEMEMIQLQGDGYEHKYTKIDNEMNNEIDIDTQ
eukprot:742783_1